MNRNPSLNLPKLAKGDSYRFHTMVKPNGSTCNLDCHYCFYLHKSSLLQYPKSSSIADNILEAHISQYIEAQTGDEVIFTWQGGEPTMVGLDFFKKVVQLQKKYKKKDQRIENDLQTNGLLLNDQWCQFLKEHHFLIGLSIDGPEALHDAYRLNKSGKPTFKKVMASIELLHRHQLPFNALCVVNRTNSMKPLAVYQFLRDEVKPQIIQFIPCVEPKDFYSVAPQYWNWDLLPKMDSDSAKPGYEDSVVTEWSVESEQWGHFLNTIWSEWFNHDFGAVFVDQFENIISILAGLGAQKCVNSAVCGKAVAIEHNGDLYSCDHYVYPEYKLGNILEVHEGDLVFSEAQKSFAYAKYKTLPQYCQRCAYLQMCWGECPKSRFIKTKDGESGLNYLCSGLKLFYAHILKDKNEILKRLSL